MILVQQFTWIGAPHIWNGDEVGMWGADDPDMRKPMVWSDLDYEDEVTHPSGRRRARNPVEPDTVLLNVHESLVDLRNDNIRLFADGALHWLAADDDRRLLAYERVLGDERAIVAFNASDQPQTLTVDAPNGTWRMAWPAGEAMEVSDGSLSTVLVARTAIVLILQ
jgi:glycosidase